MVKFNQSVMKISFVLMILHALTSKTKVLNEEIFKIVYLCLSDHKFQ